MSFCYAVRLVAEEDALILALRQVPRAIFATPQGGGVTLLLQDVDLVQPQILDLFWLPLLVCVFVVCCGITVPYFRPNTK